jgi:hypothetical protein
VRKKYQSKERKSIHKFEIVRGQELLVQVPVANGRGVGGDASSGRRACRAGRPLQDNLVSLDPELSGTAILPRSNDRNAGRETGAGAVRSGRLPTHWCTCTTWLRVML